MRTHLTLLASVLLFLFAAKTALAHPPASATACSVEQAIAAEDRAHWTEAVRIFTCVLQHNPHDWRPANAIAGDYGMLRSPAQEVQWARRAHTLAPQQAEPYINLGNGETAQHHAVAAHAAFMKAAQIRPDWWLPPYSLGVLAEQEHHAADAEQWYRKALALAPTSENVGIQLAALLGNAGRFQEAMPLLRRVLAQNPGAADAQAMLDSMEQKSPTAHSPDATPPAPQPALPPQQQ